MTIEKKYRKLILPFALLLSALSASDVKAGSWKGGFSIKAKILFNRTICSSSCISSQYGYTEYTYFSKKKNIVYQYNRTSMDVSVAQPIHGKGVLARLNTVGSDGMGTFFDGQVYQTYLISDGTTIGYEFRINGNSCNIVPIAIGFSGRISNKVIIHECDIIQGNAFK